MAAAFCTDTVANDVERHHDRRHAERQRFAQRRVVQVDAPRPEADAVSRKRRQLHRHLHEDAQRGADGDGELGELGVFRRDEHVDEHDRDDDEVVRYGGGGAPEVVAPRVEQAARNGGDAVEEQLDRKEPEEVRDELAVPGRVQEHLGPDDLGREHRRRASDTTPRNTSTMPMSVEA